MKKRGRTSLDDKAKLIFNKPTLIEVFKGKEFKDITSLEEATQKLLQISQGKFVASSNTLKIKIPQWVKDGKVKPDSNIAKWTNSGNKRTHKGRVSVREQLEKRLKKSIWKILEDTQAESIQEVTDSIVSMTSNAIKPSMSVIEKIIVQGIENKEIKENSVFASWIKPKKKRRKRLDTEKKETPTIEYEKITGKSTCTNCGHKWQMSGHIVKKKPFFWLKARRCQSCNKFGTAEIYCTINNTKFNVKMEEDTSKIISETCHALN